MAPTQSETDALFQLPLGEFTAARNSLAAKLKKAGHRAEAEAVKALPKPSISAWVVNQLYWRQRKAFDRLMASGEQFRQAQASQLAGKSAQVRGPLDARREALSELSRLAATTLTAATHQPTPDTMRRVTTTLEALSTYGNTPTAPVAGRLTDDVDPPGFETLAALVPSVGGGPLKGDSRSTVLRFQQKAPQKPASKPDGGTQASRLEQERAARQAAVKAAERELREAKTAVEKAESALRKAAASARAAEEARTEAEQRLERATEDATQAKQAARRMAGEAEEAAQAVADAERALEKATRELSAVKPS